MNNIRSTTIAIHALGGQGGGVLADWIVETAEHAGYIVQKTFIAGVAQRTGATVYYIELFPISSLINNVQKPVMALMPVPGDVDIVIACELMEAGRAVSRGFVTQDKTTLLTSSHRVYAIGEKMAMADGRQKSDVVLKTIVASAKKCVHFDMEKLAKENGAIISAVMFGAFAASGALSIERDVYENVIKKAKKAVKSNLAGFSAGFSQQETKKSKKLQANFIQIIPVNKKTSLAAKPLLNRLSNEFPIQTHDVFRQCLQKLVDYQDEQYANQFLDHMKTIVALDKTLKDKKLEWKLTRETARYLALFMTFEDTIRVADLKTRSSRFLRVRDEVKAQAKQIVKTTEFLHPRFEEVCDILPNRLGNYLMTSPKLKKGINCFFQKGRFISSDRLGGFFLLYSLGSLRSIRRMSYRYAIEGVRIREWMGTIINSSKVDYDLGCEVAACQGLLKGYGSTYERSLKNYTAILSASNSVQKCTNPSSEMRKLIDAASADENGTALKAALQNLNRNY